MPEEPSPAATPDISTGLDSDLGGGDASHADRTRFADAVVGHLTDHARRTVSAAKAGRVVNNGAEPGVLDLTPLRELLSELVAELSNLKPRQRIARALRQAADVIDAQTPDHPVRRADGHG